MKNKIYCMEKGFVEQLLSDRREILGIAKSLKTAAEMREARADFMAQISTINTMPESQEEFESLLSIENGVAKIPVVGELTPKASTDLCGGYTAEALTEYGFIVESINAAEKDETVNSIELYVDSPGGYLSGLSQAIEAVKQAKKPITAVVGDMAASAAYWIISGVSHIEGLSAISRVGSIGVATEFLDDTEALESQGYKHRVFSSSDAPNKRPDLNTEEGGKVLIKQLNDLHNVFVSDIARGRKKTEKYINENFGKGGVLTARNALSVGMIDSIRNNDVIGKTDTREESGVAGNKKSASKAGKREARTMTIEELKKENPSLYAQAAGEGREEGLKAERDRRNSIKEFAKIDPENETLQSLCNEAIESGAANDSLFGAKVTNALNTKAKLEGENPPAVDTLIEGAVLTGEEKALANALELTPEEFKKGAK